MSELLLLLLTTLRQWADNISPGGYWRSGGYAGLWYLRLGNDRSYSYGNIGFRPEELATLVHDAEDAPRLRARVAKLEAEVARLREGVTEVLGCHAEVVVSADFEPGKKTLMDWCQDLAELRLQADRLAGLKKPELTRIRKETLEAIVKDVNQALKDYPDNTWLQDALREVRVQLSIFE